MDLELYKNKEIPTKKFPSIKEYSYGDEKYDKEELVSLSKKGLLTRSQYFFGFSVPGSYRDCFARESVANMLVNIDNKLKENGLRLLIWDGYRPICIQQRLWNYYRQDIKLKNPELSDEELDFKTSFFVSKPSYNIERPSLHNSGGAVDLTLYDEINKKELNMGTKFDDFSDKAWSNHFEIYEENKEVRDNRRLLYNLMIEEGFTNLPSEWWHYDFGTKFWAYFKNTDALYKGILDAGNLCERFPLF